MMIALTNSRNLLKGINLENLFNLIVVYIFIEAVAMYEGYSKSSKTNSKKYFIYEIYKIIFLHSFHLIHNKRCFHQKIPGWNFLMETSLVMNWMETM